MMDRIYISREEATKRQSFFGHFEKEDTNYIFIKDFCNDNELYEIYTKEEKELVSTYSENEVLYSSLKYYILKNTNITAY